MNFVAMLRKKYWDHSASSRGLRLEKRAGGKAKECTGHMPKVQTRTEQQLRATKGIHLEPIKSDPPYQSIRLDQGPRAKVLVDGDTMVFLDLERDHDKAYGKK